MFHKLIVSALVLIYSSVGFTAACMTSPASTSFFLNEKESGNYKMQIIHHLGIESAPFYSGLVTGYTLPTMEEKSAMTQKLGRFINYEFKKEECQFQEKRYFCFHDGKQTLGDLEVDTIYLHSYKQRTETPFGVFDERIMQFQYRVNGVPHEIRMLYSESDCS